MLNVLSKRPGNVYISSGNSRNSMYLRTSFYRATIESVLSFAITVGFGSLTYSDKKRPNKIIKTAGRIIGVTLTPLDTVFKQRSLKKSKAIAGDTTHPAHSLFTILPSGRRYKNIKARTNRFKNSFFPTAVSLLSEGLT